MGVPATFSAVELDRPTSQAIEKGLERIFPLYYAFGRHKHRKRLVDIWTPLHRRIVDQKDFQEKRALIDSGQCVVTEMVVTSPQDFGQLKTRDFRRNYPQKGVRHEALEVHGGADCFCTAPG